MRDTNVSSPRTTSLQPLRHLKVYYAYYGNGFNNSYPVIRIAGKYLRSFGFDIGTQVRIDLADSKITISKVAS